MGITALRWRRPLIRIKKNMELLTGKYDQFEGFIPFEDGFLMEKWNHYSGCKKILQWDAFWGRWTEVTKFFESKVLT